MSWLFGRIAPRARCVVGTLAVLVLVTHTEGADARVRIIEKFHPTIVFRPPEGGFSNFTSLLYAADGKTLVAGAEGGSIRFYDTITAREENSFRIEPIAADRTSTVHVLGRSPDGRRLLVAGSREKELEVLDFATGRSLAELKTPYDHSVWPDHVAYSPDGALVAGCFWTTGEVVVWDATSGKGRFITPTYLVPPGVEPSFRATHPIPANSTGLVFTPDGSLLLTAGIGAPLRAWNTRTRDEVRPPIRISRSEHIAAAPDNKTAIFSERVDADGVALNRFHIYAMDTWKKQSEWVSVHNPHALALANDADHVIWVEHLGSIMLLDAGGNILSTWDWNVPRLAWPSLVAFSPNGKHVAVSTPGETEVPMFGLIKLLDIEGGRLKPRGSRP